MVCVPTPYCPAPVPGVKSVWVKPSTLKVPPDGDGDACEEIRNCEPFTQISLKLLIVGEGNSLIVMLLDLVTPSQPLAVSMAETEKPIVWPVVMPKTANEGTLTVIVLVVAPLVMVTPEGTVQL